MKSTAVVINILFAFGFFLAGTQSANAYIDPGTGSLWMQMALSLLLGLLFTIKLYWKKIKANISNLRGSHDKEKEA